MSLAQIILALVTLQRAGELVLAHYNTRRLLAQGAVELSPQHYPLIVALHAVWLIMLWILGRHQPVNVLALALYLLLQILRCWVLWTLGPRWTTRIIVLPGAPLVTNGPYRFLSHPNYAVVIGEIALLPLALHLPVTALVFTLLNAMALSLRIRAENRALRSSQKSAAS
ncbi:MAG TPA: isoprenylcysteine carboxylmethyltransferase family protein [Bradyrhizobium sp.]|nr:isoprenylcysteine carboxylmethyltransferase family protein [Bradyrhizobium sp.]